MSSPANRFNARTERWARDPDYNFVEVRARLEFLGDRLFDAFEPTRGRSRFVDRLQAWIAAPDDDDDARLLYSLLDHLYFIGPAEFDVLYKEAFRGPIMSWLLGPEVRLDSPSLYDTIIDAVSSTWFCPITDSMGIARFHHLNQITGKDLRPDWRTLVEFGDLKKIQSYVKTKKFTRLVLLEDFIASGKQATAAIQLAMTAEPKLEILVVPLIICPKGVTHLKGVLEPHSTRVKLAPAVTLGSACLLEPQATASEPPDFPALRNLLRKMVDVVGGDGEDDDTRAFGFGKIGALSVLFSNCPNNVPPIIHSTANGWPALFPRTSRR